MAGGPCHGTVGTMVNPAPVHAHTHTHNRFMALLDFVRDYPGEPAPER